MRPALRASSVARDARARLAVQGVLAAPPAVLVELDPIAIVHTVLDRVVVPPPAVGAGERDLRSVAFLLRHGVSLSRLLADLGAPAGADGAAAFTDREPETVFHRDRVDQLDGHLDVVTGHHHLDPTGEVGGARHIRRPEVELGPVAVDERGMAGGLVPSS